MTDPKYISNEDLIDRLRNNGYSQYDMEAVAEALARLLEIVTSAFVERK